MNTIYPQELFNPVTLGSTITLNRVATTAAGTIYKRTSGAGAGQASFSALVAGDMATGATNTYVLTINAGGAMVWVAPATPAVTAASNLNGIYLNGTTITLSQTSNMNFGATVVSGSGSYGGVLIVGGNLTVTGGGTLTTGGAFTIAGAATVASLVVNGTASIGSLSNGFIPVVTPANTYSYYRTVTLDHTKVGATDSTSFPVLVSGTYSYLKTTGNGGLVQNASGYDVGFFSDAALTTKLDWEIESYDATTGAVIYWVRIPTLSHTVDTVIYMAYGSSTVTTDQSNPTGVWDASTKAVYHMGTPSSLAVTDSTTTYNGTNHSATASTGQIGGAANMNGSSQYITAPNISVATNITVSVWMKTASMTQAAMLVEKDPVNNQWALLMETSQVKWRDVATDRLTYNATLMNTATWHLIAVTQAGANATMYVDGASVATTSSANAFNNGTSSTNIGSYGSGSGYLFSGQEDEVRIESAARSADWITARYNNESSPSTFYTMGSQVATTVLTIIDSILSQVGSGSSGTVTNAGNQIISGSLTVTKNIVANGTRNKLDSLGVNSAANKSCGTFTLTSGTMTISNTRVTASTIILLTPQTYSVNAGDVSVSAVSAGTSFSVQSLNVLDTRTFGYLLVEPY